MKLIMSYSVVVSEPFPPHSSQKMLSETSERVALRPDACPDSLVSGMKRTRTPLICAALP